MTRTTTQVMTTLPVEQRSSHPRVRHWLASASNPLTTPVSRRVLRQNGLPVATTARPIVRFDHVPTGTGLGSPFVHVSSIPRGPLEAAVWPCRILAAPRRAPR